MLLALGKSQQCLPLPSKKKIKKNKKAPKTKEKVGPEFPGEGAAITSAAGPISNNSQPLHSTAGYITIKRKSRLETVFKSYTSLDLEGQSQPCHTKAVYASR